MLTALLRLASNSLKKNLRLLGGLYTFFFSPKNLVLSTSYRFFYFWLVLNVFSIYLSLGSNLSPVFKELKYFFVLFRLKQYKVSLFRTTFCLNYAFQWTFLMQCLKKLVLPKGSVDEKYHCHFNYLNSSCSV